MTYLIIYVIQTILGAFIWKKVLFNGRGYRTENGILSLITSAIVFPNILYLIAVTYDYIVRKLR